MASGPGSRRGLNLVFGRPADQRWDELRWRDALAKLREQLAAAQTQTLPSRYFSLFCRWCLFGIPGFGSVMIILWLMIAKPF